MAVTGVRRRASLTFQNIVYVLLHVFLLKQAGIARIIAWFLLLVTRLVTLLVILVILVCLIVRLIVSIIRIIRIMLCIGMVTTTPRRKSI